MNISELTTCKSNLKQLLLSISELVINGSIPNNSQKQYTELMNQVKLITSPSQYEEISSCFNKDVGKLFVCSDFSALIASALVQ